MKSALVMVVALAGLAGMGTTFAEEPVAVPDPKAIAAGLLGQAVAAGSRGFTVVPRTSTVAINIRFEINSAKLRAEATPQLDALWQALTLPELRGKRVEISGHTDSKGDDSYNLKLSEDRATTVREYLLTKGKLAESRVQARGFGEQQPLPEMAGDDPSNRRVEVRLLSRTGE